MGVVKCECKWLYLLPESPFWYYISNKETVVEVINVVETNVQFDGMSLTNMPSKKAMRVKFRRFNGKKITSNSHHEILDKIKLRDDMEHNPAMAYIDDTGYKMETGKNSSKDEEEIKEEEIKDEEEDNKEDD